MLAGLLLNLFEEIMGYPYGGGPQRPQATWLKSQSERDKLLKEDDDVLSFVTTFVTTGVI